MSSPTDIALGVDKALEAKENNMVQIAEIDAIGAGGPGYDVRICQQMRQEESLCRYPISLAHITYHAQLTKGEKRTSTLNLFKTGGQKRPQVTVEL